MFFFALLVPYAVIIEEHEKFRKLTAYSLFAPQERHDGCMES